MMRRIAGLAHLEFEESELPRIAEQLSAVLTHMESLARIDTSRVEPTFHSLEHASPLREDVPRAPAGDEKAPEYGAGPFVVPRIIG